MDRQDVRKSDVVIAVDTSASISDGHWASLMSFMDKLIDDLPIEPTGMSHRHRRRHVRRAGMGVPVLKMTASERRSF